MQRCRAPPRLIFGIPSRAVAASPARRDEQKLAGWPRTSSLRPLSFATAHSKTFNNHFSSLTGGPLQEGKAALLIPHLQFPHAGWGLNIYTGSKDWPSPC